MKKLWTFEVRDFPINRNFVFRKIIIPEFSGKFQKTSQAFLTTRETRSTRPGPISLLRPPPTTGPPQTDSPPARRPPSGLPRPIRRRHRTDRAAPMRGFDPSDHRRRFRPPPTMPPVRFGSSPPDLSIHGGGSSNHGLWRSDQAWEVWTVRCVNAYSDPFRSESHFEVVMNIVGLVV
jgi:hypothetical protein